MDFSGWVHLPEVLMNSPLRTHSALLPMMADTEHGCPAAANAAASRKRETPMLRKITLALAAATVVATAAIPTAASAHWRDGWRHYHRPHYGVSVRYAAPYYAYYRPCFLKKRWVRTHWGWRLQRVRVCG